MGHRHLPLIGLLAAALLGVSPLAAPASAAGRDVRVKVVVDGMARTASVHVPPQKPGILGFPVVPLVPYRGGTVEGRSGGSAVLSAKASAKRWRTLAGCGKPAAKALPDKAKDGTTVSVLVAKKCDRGSAVKLYTVHGGGHTWPGGRQYLPAATIGRTSRDFDASATIWAFFAAHAR